MDTKSSLSLVRRVISSSQSISGSILDVSVLNMFRKPLYFMFLGNLATVIAQLSYDGPAYEYPDYTSGPTVECTSTRSQISMITLGPEISRTLEACATLKDDAGG